MPAWTLALRRILLLAAATLLLFGCKPRQDPRLLGTAAGFLGPGAVLAFDIERPDGWPDWVSPPQGSVCRAGESFVQNGRDLAFVCYLISPHEDVVTYYTDLLTKYGLPFGLDPPAPHPKGVRSRRTSMNVQNLEQVKKKHALIINIQELDEARAAELGVGYVENLNRIEMHVKDLGF